MKANIAGLFGIALLIMAFVVPLFRKPVPYLVDQILALSFSFLAVNRNRNWLPLTAISVLLTAQAVLAAAIEG
jgi:hypothetical protein